MEIQEIKVGMLHPNPWNVNRMAAKMRAKLVAYLKREGLVEPIVVRPHPKKKKGQYEILGGFHRWEICKDDLEYETVPCTVVKLDDRRAKVLSINLNSMKGETVPSLMASLLRDLEEGMPIADLEATLPMTEAEIEDHLSLLQVPEGFADDLEQEQEKKDKTAPEVVTIVLDRKQFITWNRALAAAEDEVGGARNPKARTLEILADNYLKQKKGKARA